MATERHLLIRAIRDWRARGLISPDQAASLEKDTVEKTDRAARLKTRYLLAGTGAAVMIIAVSVFLSWVWPEIGEEGRSVILAGIGVVLHLAGVWLENAADRWKPGSYLLQSAGLVILLGAFLYSEEAWADLTPGGIIVGVAALSVPLVLGRLAVGRNVIMPAVQAALGFAFFWVFLDRVTPLEPEVIIWILDGVLVLAIVVFLRKLAVRMKDPEAEWVLFAFLATCLSGLVLVFFTGAVNLDLEEEVVYGLDLWLGLVSGLTLWGVHRAPVALRRDWYESVLMVCVILGGLFLFWTLLGPLEFSPEPTALFVGAFGGIVVAYGIRRSHPGLILTGCLWLLAATWYYGVEKEGLLATAFALAVSAVILIWISGRLGRKDEGLE